MGRGQDPHMAKKIKKSVEKIDTAKISDVFKSDKSDRTIDDLKKSMKNMTTKMKAKMSL